MPESSATPRAPRVLLFGFRRQLNQEAVRRALASARPERLGLVSRSDFLEGAADEFLSARNGLRACTLEANPYRCFPPGALLERLRGDEVVALRMYERIFRGAATGQSYELRRALWVQHVAWAHGLLVEGGYTRVIFSEIPHHPFPFVLHAVARALGLEVRFFAQVQVKDTHVIAHGIEELFDPIALEHRRLIEAGLEVPDEALAPHMQAEIARRTGQHQPFYMGVSDLPLHRRLYARSKKFFRADDRLRLHRTLQGGMAYRSARRPVPGPDERFVYFPLHLQPEATTSPMGGVFVEQGLAVETLARALPPGWKVVVKENPAQRYAKRDRGFYQHLGSIPQVHLVHRDAPTFDLIERSEAVATITGTAGWEALFLGKPSIVFGRAFYRDAPGAIAVEDAESLAASLHAVAEGTYPCADPAGLRRFLMALQHTSHHGVVDAVYLRDSDLPLETSIDRMAASLCTLLRGEDPVSPGAGRAPAVAVPTA